MVKMYVVHYLEVFDEYDQNEDFFVFSTREKAENFVKNHVHSTIHEVGVDPE